VRRRPCGRGASLGLLALGVATRWALAPTDALAQQADLVAFAQAYTTAWNAHDLAAVLACFAPDAVVRHRDAMVPEAAWASEEAMRQYLYAEEGWHYGLVWARGAADVADVTERAFAAHAHTDTSAYRTAGETVTWRYVLHEDPFHQFPGVGPVTGVAEAVVRGRQIVQISTVHDADSVQRRHAALLAHLGVAPTTAAARPLQARRTQDGVEPTPLAWPLTFGGLAAAGSLLAAWRRRRD
jgi:hypothetical protein